MEAIRPIILTLTQSKIVQLVAILVIMDIIFGCLRAVKEKEFNSTIGINGLIRKAGILISLLFMGMIDNVITLDLIGFIPDAIKQYLPVSHVGCLEFFGIIYIIYEVLSVLKNMTLSGLPLRRVWEAVKKFLQANTSEIMVLDDNIEELAPDEAIEAEEMQRS